MRCTILLALLLAPYAFAAAPALVVEGDDGTVALELRALAARTTIRGHLARTELELTYFNAMSRDTRGQFRFPLPADAEVSDLGLWFDGKLRHAVAVERVLARQAYEEVVHRGIDPALVEWSPDQRSFSLDVYPIPAKGEKKVFIAYDQELLADGYLLDLRYARKLASLDVRIDAEGRSVTNDDGVYRVARESGDVALAAQASDGWYAAAAIEVAPERGAAPPAPHVVIFHDTSSSAVQQDRARIAQFLTAFLARQQAWGTADVIPFHIALESPQRIEAIGTSAAARTLERILGDQQPFGATNLVAVAKRMREIAGALPPASRIVLVTDGLTSLGDSRDVSKLFATLAEMRRPLLVINASPSANDALLDKAAQATHGWSIDLAATGIEEALEIAMTAPSLVHLGNDVVPPHLLTSARMRVSAAMRSAAAPSTFRGLPLRYVSDAAGIAMVRRAYARALLREMLARDAADDELLAHGRRFTQLTPRTSLLVLDSWRDYERYGIEMPPDVAELKRREQEQWSRPIEPRPFVPNPAPPLAVVKPGDWFIRGRVTDDYGSEIPGTTITLYDGTSPLVSAITDAEGRFTIGTAVAPREPCLVAELSGFNTSWRLLTQDTPAGTQIDLMIEVSSVSEAITVTAEAPAVDVQTTAMSASVSLRTSRTRTDELLDAIAAGEAELMTDDPEVAAEIAKQRHALTDGVIAKLRAIGSTSERIRYYLSARAVLGGSKSFHIFAATAFRERSPELAARILSDLAEAQPMNAPLLRILARVLDGWDEPELAELLLQRAIEIAPLEMQSWRELILLEARLGRTSEVASWSRRLRARTNAESENRDLRKMIDAALARWESASFFDRMRGVDLRVAPDTDLAVELMFDTGWSYVDLHVTEPGGETVKWNHTESASGATHIGGYVFGYGPQIYTLRDAPRGAYVVNADYYSDDETFVSLESLAHVIVLKHGKRSDAFVLMRFDDETKRVMVVEME